VRPEDRVLFIGCFVALLPLVIKDIADVPSAFLDVRLRRGIRSGSLCGMFCFR